MLKIVPGNKIEPSAPKTPPPVVYATFQEAVVYTFSQQVSVNVSSTVLTGDAVAYLNTAGIHVLATIGITCPQLTGEATLSFPKDSFLKLANEMLGAEFDTITDENVDLCGELLNMIFGVAKAKLKDKDGFPIEKAIPFVVHGPNMHFSAKGATPTVVTQFEGPFGIFYLGVTISLCDTTK
jgi:CheY-specific phosphatase CheX